MPGPASSQAGLAIGYLRAGYPGAAMAWLGFTAPSAAIMTLARLRLRVRMERRGGVAACSQAGRRRGRRPGGLDDGTDPVDRPAAHRDRHRRRYRSPRGTGPRDADRGHRSGRGGWQMAARDRPPGGELARRGDGAAGRGPRRRSPRRCAAARGIRRTGRRPAYRGERFRASGGRRVRVVLPGWRARVRRRARRAPAPPGRGGGAGLGGERRIPGRIRGGPRRFRGRCSRLRPFSARISRCSRARSPVR